MRVPDMRLTRVFAAIDDANARDPNTVEIEGRREPAEFVYGRRMSDVLARMVADASLYLRIATRGSISSAGRRRARTIRRAAPASHARHGQLEDFQRQERVREHKFRTTRARSFRRLSRLTRWWLFSIHERN
jgi:hypothetical protein